MIFVYWILSGILANILLYYGLKTRMLYSEYKPVEMLSTCIIMGFIALAYMLAMWAISIYVVAEYLIKQRKYRKNA